MDKLEVISLLEDLSHHLLDIAENGVNAGADFVDMGLEEDFEGDLVRMWVRDNGRGMSKEVAEMAVDPFYTSRSTRKVGLGLPFLKQAAEACGGTFRLESKLGEGTLTEASFRLSHIDRPPVGDLGSTMMALLSGHPNVRWRFTFRCRGQYVFDSAEALEILEDPELFKTPDVCLWVRDSVREGVEEARRGG
ncbi:ATP-binding protein [Thermanaerovibrio velox]|uniref:ATP-binding protein n=1 Tax=Thermanaerovibrio velox TaxID=108007 RepID=UPI001FDF3647|nr:sensor histidine kinase [Thermanaerovibrio velox]